MSAGPGLDDLLARARAAEVRPELAAAAVADAARAVRVAAPPRRWRWPLVAGGLAVAAAVLVLLVRPRPGGPTAATVLTIGDRVAIAVEPGGRYGVVAADADRTIIAIERGTVTARLWPGARRYHLALRGADVVATATGTIYTLAVDDRGAVVRVHAGTVAVVEPGGTHAIRAGAWWPADAAGRDLGTAAAARLLALAAPTHPPTAVPAPLAPVAVDAGVTPDTPDAAGAPDAAAPRGLAPPPVDAGLTPRDPAGAITDAGPAVAPADAAAPAMVERWRQARLLRAQGQPHAAAAACLAIAAAGDPTWAPIALVEAIRINLDALAAPEAALALADRMLATWPAHSLVDDTRQLRCRALRQLGRGAECAP
ncbi:MAG: hypothetical protein IPL61_39465 [Myxococcales bacterium]|nr:hypothetical protein [Myxococcales bacterium]